jgi:hypothetical protein
MLAAMLRIYLTRVASAVLLCSSLAFAAAACGGDDDGSTPTVDAAPGQNPDGSGPAADAGPVVGVVCDTMTCSSSQVCCVTVMGDAGSATCVAPGTCQGAAAACDGPEDCGGHACCGTASGQNLMTACQTGDVCEGLAIQACHSDHDCTANNQTSGTCCVAGSTGFCQFVNTDCPQ